jgi:hypothetical protein
VINVEELRSNGRGPDLGAAAGGVEDRVRAESESCKFLVRLKNPPSDCGDHGGLVGGEIGRDGPITLSRGGRKKAGRVGGE